MTKISLIAVYNEKRCSYGVEIDNSGNAQWSGGDGEDAVNYFASRVTDAMPNYANPKQCDLDFKRAKICALFFVANLIPGVNAELTFFMDDSSKKEKRK